MAVGSRFARYMNPILAALRDLGGSARPGEVFDWIADDLGITEEERAVVHQSGGSRFENDVSFARFYLVRSGYLDSSKRGVWSLTELGRQTKSLSDDQIGEIIRKVQETAPRTTVRKPSAEELEREASEQAEMTAPEDVPRGYRERVLEIMRMLPPKGFEQLCQRLLRESGFQQVRVTGRSGDGGIDGIGILLLNPDIPFVTVKVVFQCKKWTAAVGSPEVRNFRGSMMGRADKGLVLTTSTFTADAQSEAIRDGVPPIELVDGQAIVDLLEKLNLGLIPRTTYEVDSKFFEEFTG